MKKAKEEKQQFISPIIARHFILNLPKVKDNYQKNAVRFSLRSLYPGTDESTVTDYFYCGSKVIGIAANVDTINEYKKKSKKIFSPYKGISNSKNSINIFLSDEWLSIYQIHDKEPVFLKTYTKNSLKIFKKDISTLLGQIDNGQSTVTVYNLCDKLNDVSLILNELNISYSIENKPITNHDEIFSSARSHINFFTIVFILLVLFLLIFNVILSRKNIQLTDTLTETKNEYVKLKNGQQKKQITSSTPAQTLKEKLSTISILSEISNSSDSMRILSLSIAENSFKIEADTANAISVSDVLSESENLNNIILHQVIPQPDGKDRFTLSGEIVND